MLQQYDEDADPAIVFQIREQVGYVVYHTTSELSTNRGGNGNKR